MRRSGRGKAAAVALVAIVTTLPLFWVSIDTAGASTAATKSASAATAAKKKPTPWRPTPGVKFNLPRVGGERQFRIERQVIAAINHARRGSTIKMAMFSFDRFPVTDALIRAKRHRKVHVQVILNGHETTPAQKKLRKALGTKRSHKSYFYHCKSSCRGEGDIQHSKFILFTQTGAAKNVVMLGSVNMKLNGSENQFNDLLTITNSTKLYTILDTVFDQMRRDRMAKKPYIHVKWGAQGQWEIFVMPFPRKKWATKKTKWTPARDPISRILAPVRCTGAKTDSGRTIIRVDMHAWDGARGLMLAKKYRSLYAAGCDVRIMIGFAGAQVRKVFASPTARGKVPVRSTGFDTDDDDNEPADEVIDLYSHEKQLLIHGNYAGARDRKLIVTGSSNYQDGGQYGDELIFRKYDAKLYAAYAAHWKLLWDKHSHAFGESAVIPPERGERVAVPQETGVYHFDWRDE